MPSRSLNRGRLDPYRPEIEAPPANGPTQRLIAGRCDAMPAGLSNRLGKNGIGKPRP